MPLYDVTLTYPRQTRQPAYSEAIEATTKAEAMLRVTEHAKAEGWTGMPLKQEATLARSEQVAHAYGRVTDLP